MPQAIAGALFASGTFGYAVTYALVTMAINYGLSALASSLVGKPNQNRAGPGRDVTVRGTTEPMQMIYGEVRTPGFIAYMGTSGNRNEFLHYVVVWAAHQCDGIAGIWVDSSSATVSLIDGSMTGDGVYPPGGPAVAYAWHHLGEKNQNADSTLVSAISAWDSECRGAGLCYTHFRLEYHEGVFANGAPQNFFAYVKGRRLYDPRLDSTNGGSGSHRRDDATTWAHSSNWALCIRDYITGGSRWYDETTPEKRLGFGESDSRIDDSFVISQANVCDESVSIPGGTQARYTCDVQLSCGDTFKENLEILKTAAAGNVTYVNGRYRIYAGAYEAPTVALGPDDFVGAVQVTTHPRKEDVYNMITGVFYNEDADWQLSTFPNIANSSYESEDGGQRVRRIELPATRSNYRAQRIAILHLAQSRNKIRISASKLSAKALRIAQWQTFSVTLPEFGWDNKVFRCLNWEWDPSSGFPSIVAREESPSAYVDPDVETYAEPHESTVDTPSYDLPATPINFSVTPRIDGLLFQWEVPAPVNTNQTYHLYEHTSNSPFSSATRIWSGKATSAEVALAYGSTRYYWVTAELNGVESEEAPAGNGIEGESLPPPADGAPGSPGAPGAPGADGSDGAPGLSVAELSIYLRSASSPSTPSGGSYDFGTLTLTPPSGWSSAIPTGSNPIYASRSVAAVVGQSGTDSTLTWSSPVLVTQEGEGVDIVFIRSATQPSTPSASSGTPAGWYSNVSSVPGSSDPMWSSVGTRENSGQNWTWQPPIKIEGQDGAPGADGAPGSPGADGSDGAPGLTVTFSLYAYSIQCDAAGVPISGAFSNAVGQVTVYDGNTDVTASATYSSTTSNVTGSVNTATNTPVTGARGSYRITAMSAETGYLEITTTYSGKTVVSRFTVQKSRAGSASQAARDNSFNNVTVTSYPVTGQGGPIEVAVGPNGTITVSVDAFYQCTIAEDTTVTGKVQYREKGTSTWFDFPSTETTGTPFIYSTLTPGQLLISPTTMSAPSSLRIYEFQLVMRATNPATFALDYGVLSASWAP